MKRDRIMKSVIFLCLAWNTISSKALDYKFKMKNGQPELEVVKEDKKEAKKHSQKSQTFNVKPLTDMQMIQLNPTLAPMIELGDILKEFTKTMKQKKKHKKHKKRKAKKRKLHIKKTSTKQTKSTDSPARKTFIPGMSTGGSAALLGGGALVAGVGAGMAMGAADNEKLEQEISLKENEFGIMKIREKVEDDINQELFTSSIKIRGLREKAKAILLNGENSISEVEDQMDNALGNLTAMDKHMAHAVG